MIDTHAHVNLDDYTDDREDVFTKGVGYRSRTYYCSGY